MSLRSLLSLTDRSRNIGFLNNSVVMGMITSARRVSMSVDVASALSLRKSLTLRLRVRACVFIQSLGVSLVQVYMNVNFSWLASLAFLVELLTFSVSSD